MKKLFFFLIMAFLFVGMYSCEKDEAEPLNQEALLHEAEANYAPIDVVVKSRGQATVPFHAEYLVELGEDLSPPPLWIVPLYATGKATHLGKSTWTSTSTLYGVDFTAPLPLDPLVAQDGTMTFTAADGSTLVGAFTGFFDGFGGWGDYVIEYGTGRFEGAYTQADCDCTYFWVNNLEGPNYLEFNGTLTNP
jgi:hypothetical protein